MMRITAGCCWRRCWLVLAVVVAVGSLGGCTDAFVPSPRLSWGRMKRQDAKTEQRQQQQQQQRQQQSSLIVGLRYSLAPVSTEKESSSAFSTVASTTNNKNNAKSDTSGPVALPFVIERLPNQPGEEIYEEISQMCINAFFNDGPTNRRIPFWKDWQLRYLRTLQQSDLRIRRKRYPDTNMMLVARQVVPVGSSDEWTAQKSPLVLDLQKVYNLSAKEQRANTEYVKGPVLGFVEVTLRPYGLGNELVGFDEESRIQLRRNVLYTKRPILTNLSVKYEARQSGVGSCLMEFCEEQVNRQWSENQIILEVEDDNINALRFYQKRGFQELYQDPSGRRYDTNGFVLRQLRCRRIIMRKEFTSMMMGGLLNNKNNNNNNRRNRQSSSGGDDGSNWFLKLRDSIFMER